ncbi:MAG: metallophosphoesterase [Nitrososphaeria archaeon]|nr:metallophosphoesterase [Nitrososphaeria archaeon]
MERRLAKKLVEEAMRRGYTLTKRALELLGSAEDPIKALDKAIKEVQERKRGSTVIDAADIEGVMVIPIPPRGMEATFEAAAEAPPEPEIEVDERFLNEYRIKGSIDEFNAYFRSRYEKSRRIFEERLVGLVDLRSVLKMRDGQEAYTVAMLFEKRDGERAIFIALDDPTAQATVIVPKNDKKLIEVAESVLPDSIIAVKVYKRGESLIAREILLPDIPTGLQEKWALGDFNVCLISDLHVGSKKFRDDLFEKFLDWINRSGDPEVRETRILIIAGDLIDGVGVYPNQHNDLEIISLREQLEKLAGLISEMPPHIKVAIVPGNHEPIQRALPQPPLSGEYRSILEKCGRELLFLGNPAWIRVGSRLLLVYHGQGLDDIIQSVPEISHSNLNERIGEAMEIMLRHRHLCPIYGESTPILPLAEDLLVIDKIPSILHVGHVHVAYAGAYRGIRVINAGTWQEQTSYQRSMGLNPTVGVAAIVNLKDLSVRLKQFM